MRYISLFAGIEAASVAWEPLGWESVAFAEVDAFPSAVLAERFPDVPNLGDVTKVDWMEVIEKHGAVDLVVGGSPCQSFSVAGNRTGLEGASGLMWEYVRALRDIRPRWALWENVPGCLSSGPEGQSGEDFGCLLRALDELGYGLAWRVLDAQFFGVAQRRRRVFLVGRLGAEPPVAVLFEPDGLRWDFESSGEKRETLTGAAGSGSRGYCFKWQAGGVYSISVRDDETSNAILSQQLQAVCIQGSMIGREDRNGPNGPGLNDDIAFTLNTTDRHGVMCMSDTQSNTRVDSSTCRTLSCHTLKDPPVVAFAQNQRHEVRLEGGDGSRVCALASSPDFSKGQGSSLIADGYIVRRLTPRECERLQGFPDDWTRIPYRGKTAEECPDGPRYKVIGNSMAVPVMRWIGERIDMFESEVGA